VRIFLTGATGYIGTALALRLRTDGHELRALVRPSSRGEELARIGVALFVGDLADRASMREGMSGADWVVHAAAELDLEAPPERMALANRTGSENVASLAHKLGVPRFLSISSIARWGGSPDDGTPATEETPPRLPLPTRYAETKAAGEAAIQAWAARGLAVTTIFPSLVFGPPGKKRGANALLRQIHRGRFPFLFGGDRKASWVFLDDLVEGIVRALDRAPAGRGYLMAGEVLTHREVVARVAGLGGAPPPRLEVGVGTARLLFRLAAPLYRLRGRRLPVPIEQLASLERHWAFDDRRARAELDWRPRPFTQALAVTIDYLAAGSG
jgi:nucleoside-diphosphate-sugar epimerase